MSIICTRCGKELLRDDSRFCNNCGAPVVAPSALHAPSHEAPPESPLPQKPMLREQIAQQPAARPSRHALPQEPPEWMSQLDRPDYVRKRKMAASAGNPEPLDAAAVVPQHQEAPPLDEALPEQQAFPLPAPQVPTARPSRELRVKIWDEDTSSSSVASTEAQLPSAPQEPLIEEFPTSPLLSNASPPEEAEGAIERLETSPLLASPVAPAERPAPWDHPLSPAAVPVRSPQDERDRIEALDTVHMPLTPASRPPLPAPAPATVPAQNLDVPVSASSPPAPISSAGRRRKRAPLVLMLVLLLLILLGATGAWIWLQQSFSVPGTTEPYQTFSDSTLGLSLRYPTGWSVERDAAKSLVTLADSSHTAQVQVLTSDAAAKLDLNQQAAKVGLTNLKPGAVPATLSFAGTTWQQIQGTMQQNGATYTGTLLATKHNQRLYTLVLLAPQSIYEQEEQISFSALRASLRFLS